MSDGVGLQAFGHAVLRIRAQPDGAVVGAGFLVTDDLALTCAHVVSAAVSTRDDEPPPDDARLLVDLPLTGDDAIVTATVERWLPPDPAGPDVAMLRLPSRTDAGRPVRLVDPSSGVWDHRMRTIGFPDGRLDGVWHSGRLRAAQGSGWIQAELAAESTGYQITHGFSGGPVWDDELSGVIGMTVTAETAQGRPPVSYLIPVGKLLDCCPELRDVVTVRRAESLRTRPLLFEGTRARTRQELAAAIRRDWATARDRFVAHMGTTHAPSEGWRDLLDWLRQFDDVEGRVELIDRYLTGDLPPDLKLLHLLRWLDPDGPVIYRGRPVTYERLVDVCLTGRSVDAGPDRALLTDLTEQRLLDVLAGFTDLGDLAGAQERWDDLSAKWRRIVGGAVIPRSVVRGEAHSVTGLLLVAAIAHPYAMSRLRTAARRGGEPPPSEHDYWFRSLVAEAGGPDSSLGLIVRARFTGHARAYAQARAESVARRAQDEREREAREAAHAERERAWAAYEAGRLTIAARLGAFGRAVAWHGMWTAFAVVATWLVWGWIDPYVARLVSMEIALIVGIAVITRRAVAALSLGAAYRPPLWQISRWFPANARTAASGARTKLLPAAAFILIGGAAAQWGEKTAGAAYGLGDQLAGAASSIAIVAIFFMAFIYAYSVGSRLRRWDEDYQAALRNYGPDHNEPFRDGNERPS